MQLQRNTFQIGMKLCQLQPGANPVTEGPKKAVPELGYSLWVALLKEADLGVDVEPKPLARRHIRFLQAGLGCLGLAAGAEAVHPRNRTGAEHQLLAWDAAT